LIIFRYLARQVLTTMLAVTLVLLLIFMSGRFIKYLAQAASGSLSPDILFSVMAFRLPGFLELILPLGFFLGILLAYGRMYLESEMTVLHACRFSQARLTGMTLAMATVVALIVGGMSLYLSPMGMQKVEQLFVEQSKLTEFEMLFPGKFQRLRSGGRVTYAGALSDDKKTMYEVFITEPAREGRGLNLIYAESGTQYVDEENGERFLVLHDGRRYEGEPGAANYEVVLFDAYGIRINQPDAEERKVKEEAIPTAQLIASSSSEDQATLQWRLALPFLVPVVSLLALSMCRVNPRQGRFFHLFPAMLVYIVYLGLLIVVRKKIAEDQFPQAIGLWGVHGLFLLISLLLLTRERWIAILRKGQRVRVQ